VTAGAQPRAAAPPPALVTGAGRGIGRAIALRLARDGCAVCLAARSGDELDTTARRIEVEGGRAVAIPCDLTVDGAVEELVERAAGELGGLGVLVNNAGGAHRVDALEALDERAFELGTTLNYAAVHRAMRTAAPHLFAAAPRACVLNIVSIAAARGIKGMSYYSGAKSAVVGLSRAVAREWGPRGVRVNCLGPGWIATELSRPLMQSQEFSAETLDQVPLGRWGTPEDVAEAAAFLVSDAARYITGTTLYVDGGLLA
jgi:NAD(P)-dependent dehydrogenase (short-subunit alcohol dehydrogenase family)